MLSLTAETAERLGHRALEPEHLLTGVLRVETSLAAQVLKSRGVTLGPIEAELAKGPGEKRESVSRSRALLTLEYFLKGLKTMSMEELLHYFAKNAEFIDGLGTRWSRSEIEGGFANLFAACAKRNAEYLVEGTLAKTDRLSVYTVLWKNSPLASEERAWMHRMTLVLSLDEEVDWKILFGQVTLVKPFSAAASYESSVPPF